MAKRPPSSCTIGRSSGGITGTASRTIHSGRFSDLMKALTTFRRLIARCCRCPFEVRIVSRSESASATRSRSLSRSRIASAPMPPRKYTPNPYGEPKRSFISRKICSSGSMCLTSSSRNFSQVCSSRRCESSAASRVSARRDSMSRYISRTFSDHWMTASRSSRLMRPSVRRQRSFARSRSVAASAPSSAVSITSRSKPLPTSRDFSRFLRSTPETSSASSPSSCSPAISASSTLLMRFVSAPFFEPDAFSASARSSVERLGDLLRRRADVLELARREPAVVADGRVADELADLLRVLGRDRAGDLDEEAGHQVADLLERRQALLLGPVREAAAPELVVLVEVALLALREVGAAPLQPVLERGERLVAVDVDALVLRLDLVLEVVQVLRPGLVVHVGDDRGGEVQDLLELARGDVEQVADPAGDALEEPDVRDGRGQVDVAHALAAHLLPRHLDAAALADDPLVADALVLAAVALPVLGRTEDALAEEAVALGLERAVVDGLRLGDLARTTSRGSACSRRVRCGSRRSR